MVEDGDACGCCGKKTRSFRHLMFKVNIVSYAKNVFRDADI